jgi:hypothetical protein
MKAEKADVPALVSRTVCAVRGGLVSLVLNTSRALMRFEMPVPKVAFLVNGACGEGSTGNGGHWGKAVETLLALPLADLPRSGVVAVLRLPVE